MTKTLQQLADETASYSHDATGGIPNGQPVYLPVDEAKTFIASPLAAAMNSVTKPSQYAKLSYPAMDPELVEQLQKVATKSMNLGRTGPDIEAVTGVEAARRTKEAARKAAKTPAQADPLPEMASALEALVGELATAGRIDLAAELLKVAISCGERTDAETASSSDNNTAKVLADAVASTDQDEHLLTMRHIMPHIMLLVTLNAAE